MWISSKWAYVQNRVWFETSSTITKNPNAHHILHIHISICIIFMVAHTRSCAMNGNSRGTFPQNNCRCTIRVYTDQVHSHTFQKECAANMSAGNNVLQFPCKNDLKWLMRTKWKEREKMRLLCSKSHRSSSYPKWVFLVFQRKEHRTIAIQISWHTMNLFNKCLHSLCVVSVSHRNIKVNMVYLWTFSSMAQCVRNYRTYNLLNVSFAALDGNDK